MKLCVITDTHGNYEALKTVLTKAKSESYDRIIHTGDSIGQGLYPAECLDLLRDNGVEMLSGNYEKLIANELRDIEDSSYKKEKDGHLWTYNKLTSEHLKCIATLSDFREIEYSGYRLLFCHYAMSDTDKAYKPIIRDPNVFKLRELFKSADADCIVFGHDHFGYQFNDTPIFVNPGSLGFRPGSSASYCVLSVADRISYEVVNLPYDKDMYVKDLSNSDSPNKDYITCILNMRPETPMAEAVRMMKEALGD